MDRVTLGSTGITVNKNGFGALPIQRISEEDAVRLLRKALKAGITFFDTSRRYTDSEKKIGIAFEGVPRNSYFIATKTGALTGDQLREDLKTTLEMLKTDYVDIYQFHNPPFCPLPGDGTGLYEAILEAKESGKVRHIGITNHRLHVAHTAIDSGLYETLQFPFSYVCGKQELELVEKCRQRNMGFIAMKGLSGGLLTDYRACYAFEAQFDNVLPIWGIQRNRELDQWISCIDNPPTMTPEIEQLIRKDRDELSGDFCRSCGYCMPCTVGIDIKECARMSQLIRRNPSAKFLSEEWQEKMRRINDCINCGLCMSKCPYELNTPALLRKNLEDYERILTGEASL
ncbi:MAG: aldo/keto reductase [Spirochaetales bacterium]|nr:aldo/keto reductase [Spirochaetales bacterium]